MHGILPYYGLNVAYLDFGFLYQDPAGAVLEANRWYTLSAAIGRRYDVNAAAYTISVWAGTPSEGYQRIAYYAGSTGDQQPGEWLTRSVRFQTFEGNLDEHVGKQLRVALSRAVLSGGQVNFDTVALDVSDTPEPAAIALFGTVALGLGAAAWRRAKHPPAHRGGR